MAEISLPETLIQLSEQALQPQLWSPLTWTLVISILLSAIASRRVFRDVKDLYLPCVSMNKATKMAEQVEEELKLYRDCLMRVGSLTSDRSGEYMAEQWTVVTDYEYRLMRIQLILLDISLKEPTHSSSSRTLLSFSRADPSTRWILGPLRKLWIIAESYRELRSLKSEIQISKDTSRRNQLHWDLQLRQLRKTGDSQATLGWKSAALPI
ncbi:hypothetical protein GYMLUDRAFT_65940 [Collybiopsis luxurians FD-317 M1]|nr:hypothetical protein GYMLUDRAFT_65940 [Collybiopsis luxurians FD-317 M1]